MIYNMSVVELVINLVTLRVLVWLVYSKNELKAELREAKLYNEIKDSEIDKLQDISDNLKDELIEEKQEMHRALDIIKKVTDEQKDR